MVPHGAPSPESWLAERAKDPPGRLRRDRPDAAGEARSRPERPGQDALGDPVAAYGQVSDVFDVPERYAELLAAGGTPTAAPYLVADATPPGARSDTAETAEAPVPLPGATVRLKADEEAAYDASPDDCSGAVRVLLQRQKIAFAFGNANDFMARVAQPGSGWRRVTLEEASRLANEGKVVVGGKAEPGGHGHVLAVMPGPWQHAGGFMAGGKQIHSSAESYPPAMSGSLGPYEGAHSRGEKTVYDAWSKKDFGDVTYWAHEK